MLQGMISQYSLLSRINGIENPRDELEKIAEENEDKEVTNGVYTNLVKAFQLEDKYEQESEEETA